MTYDQSGDNIGTGYGSGWMGGMWVFALVILALFFLWGRDGKKHDGYGEAVLPALALGGMNGYAKGGHCIEEKIWDVERDQMREFANVREEVRVVGHQNAMDNAKYFYDQARLIDRNNFDTALGFKQSEIGNLVQTKDILARIDKLENGMKDEKIQELTSKVNFFETVQAVRGWGIPPAHPVGGPAPLAGAFVHCNPCHP